MSDNMNRPSHRANDPLDALEQRRKQKIEQFQLNLEDEFLDPQPADSLPPQEEQVSSVPQPESSAPSKQNGPSQPQPASKNRRYFPKKKRKRHVQRRKRRKNGKKPKQRKTAACLR